MNLAEMQARAVRELVAEAQSGDLPSPGFQATVTATSPFTITWNGRTITRVPTVNYTPALGDEVAVLLFGTDPVVIGRITPR